MATVCLYIGIDLIDTSSISSANAVFTATRSSVKRNNSPTNADAISMPGCATMTACSPHAPTCLPRLRHARPTTIQLRATTKRRIIRYTQSLESTS